MNNRLLLSFPNLIFPNLHFPEFILARFLVFRNLFPMLLISEFLVKLCWKFELHIKLQKKVGLVERTSEKKSRRNVCFLQWKKKLFGRPEKVNKSLIIFHITEISKLFFGTMAFGEMTFPANDICGNDFFGKWVLGINFRYSVFWEFGKVRIREIGQGGLGQMGFGTMIFGNVRGNRMNRYTMSTI